MIPPNMRAKTSEEKRSTYLSLILLVVAAIAAHGQSVAVGPKSSPTPPVDSDVVKITTNLIQLDVTVTDSRGRIVTDLRPEELEIYQNGEKQTISNFSFISSVRSIAPKTNTSATDIPAIPTTLKPEQVRRTIALVVDDLSLSFDSVYYTR